MNKNDEIDDELIDDGSSDDRKVLLDKDGIDISTKESSEKTVEERIQTSRTLKIKNNKWNQVDYTEDFSNERITIDPSCYQSSGGFNNAEFEQKYQKVIDNSKYKVLFLNGEKRTVTYQIINELILYCYTKLKQDYSLTEVYVLTCEYCGIGIKTMFDKLSSYLQMKILNELSKISKLPKELGYKTRGMF